MKEVINKALIDKFSRHLKLALLRTLELGHDEEIFIGNEEKMFLLSLIDKTQKNVQIEDFNSVFFTDVKVPVENLTGLAAFGALNVSSSKQYFNEQTLNTMNDIYKAELQHKETSVPAFKKILILIRSKLLFIRSLMVLFFVKTIVHSLGYFQKRWFVVEELSKHIINFDIKDEALREKFKNELLKTSIDKSIIPILVSLLPISHLESYHKIKNHPLSKVKIKNVVSSIYGIMDDPLLGAIVRNNKADLFYLQHGGGYGLRSNRLAYNIESEGCKDFYYWGTGMKNIYPTRYKNKVFFKSIDVPVILSMGKNIDVSSRNFFVNLSHNLKHHTESNIILIPYPGSDRNHFDFDNVQLGVSKNAHARSRFVIYDSVGQSLLFARILLRKPFIIVDDFKYDICESNKNAQKFISLLKKCNLLVSREEIEAQANYWLNLPSKELDKKFALVARPFLKHVLDNPEIDDIFDIKSGIKKIR